MSETERINKLHRLLEQYEDGVITYVEYVRAVRRMVTAEDVDEQNELVGGIDRSRMADWPFRG